MKLSKKARKHLRQMDRAQAARVAYCAFLLWSRGLITEARLDAIERWTIKKTEPGDWSRLHALNLEWSPESV